MRATAPCARPGSEQKARYMRPYHVAIVGSGPSGYFAAASLLKVADSDRRRRRRTSTCWRCCRRRGVWCAPASRPTIRRSSRSARSSRRSPQDPRFRFFGNIVVGEHVQAAELAERYDAVIYAIGAQSDRPLNIPGEDLPGSVAAVDFVGWYNAHPHFEEMAPDLSGARAVVVGNGNVALDVARILVTDPDVLGHDRHRRPRAGVAARPRGVEEVVIIGRRGPLQAAFTTLELRELGRPRGRDVDVIVDPADFDDITDEDIDGRGQDRASRTSRCCAATPNASPDRANRRIVFRFRTSPIEIKGDERVEAIVLGRNELVTDDSGRVVAKDTGEREELPAQLVVRAVGYRGVPTPGLPFDEKQRHHSAQPTAGSTAAATSTSSAGSSAGRPGVIGSNKKRLAGHRRHAARRPHRRATSWRDFGADHADKLVEWLASRQPKLVTDDHWKLIDEHERSAGEPHGRPRVKLPSVAKLLRIGHG